MINIQPKNSFQEKKEGDSIIFIFRNKEVKLYRYKGYNFEELLLKLLINIKKKYYNKKLEIEEQIKIFYYFYKKSIIYIYSIFCINLGFYVFRICR